MTQNELESLIQNSRPTQINAIAIENTGISTLVAGSNISFSSLSTNSTVVKIDSIDGAHAFEQAESSDVWLIVHNLGFMPNVTVIDSAGNRCIGDIEYVDINTVKLTFSAPFSGKAYLS